jgi:hypothetical protein
MHKQNNTRDKHNKQDYQINIKQKALNAESNMASIYSLM